MLKRMSGAKLAQSQIDPFIRTSLAPSFAEQDQNYKNIFE